MPSTPIARCVAEGSRVEAKYETSSSDCLHHEYTYIYTPEAYCSARELVRSLAQFIVFLLLLLARLPIPDPNWWLTRSHAT